MKRFNNLSVKNKLKTITTSTAFFALLLILIFNLLFAYIGFKNDIRNGLTSLSRLIGTNCSAAIIFEDNDAAKKTLEALKTEYQVELARIYFPDGTLFSEYYRDEKARSEGNTPDILSIKSEAESSGEWETEQFEYNKGRITILGPIYMDKRLIGIVEIKSDQHGLYRAMGGIIIANFTVLVVALILATIFASKAQKTITGPLATLSETMGEISRGKDYSIRIEKQNSDELGDLFDAFNDMLSEIQKRDDELYFTKFSLDHMQDAILWVDPSARIVNMNITACELSGYTKEELRSITLYDLYPNLTPEIWKESWKYLKEKKVLSAELQTMRKDGTFFSSDIFVNHIQYNGEEYNCSFIRDITDRKKLESQLKRAQNMEAIGTLAGGVAHDLNNILGGLVGYPDLLLLDLPENSPMIKPLKTIKKSGEKAAAIVQDLLTLARRNINIQKVINLNDVVTDYLKSPEHMKTKEFHSDINFHFNLDKDLPNIMGSDVHLSKVIMNLVSNAAESMTETKGDVTISTSSCFLDSDYQGFQKIMRGTYAILSVQDKGSGISMDERENIFEPFYTKKVMGRSGTGLGMTVVSGVVKDHKGYIDLVSSEGNGTRFDLYFPVSELNIQPESSEAALESYEGNENILIVDDVEEQRELALYALKKMGYTADAVSSGEKALTFLEDHRVDLIILDMIMDPGMDGLETFKGILKINPDQKTIIASGFADSARVNEALKLGAGNYVKKPYTAVNLGKAVRTELDSR